MKKVWVYLVLIIYEILLGLAYGLLLKNFVSIEICIIAAFGVPFAVFFMSLKNKKGTIRDLSEMIFASLLLTAVAIGVFTYGNQLHGEFVGEYNVVVEYMKARGGGYAEFINPQGKEGRVDLNDYRPIIFDDEDCVDDGDTIRVREYKGVFDETYYVFIEEIH